jgi:hypothetical protein
VTALFAEYTGAHPPLEVDWSLERGVRTAASHQRPEPESVQSEHTSLAVAESAEPARPRVQEPATESARERAFATFWEFAVAVNRSDPAALAMAGNSVTSEIPIDGAEVRKLVTTMWFRSVMPRLSREWRDRVLNVLVEYVTVSDHRVKVGRQTMRLQDLTDAQLQEVGSKMSVTDVVRLDLDLLIAVSRFWGADAVKRFRFVEVAGAQPPTKVEGLLDRFLG